MPSQHLSQENNPFRADNSNDFWNFVLEVGIGEKSRVLRELAEGYVRAGSDLVITFDLSYRCPGIDLNTDPTPYHFIVPLGQNEGFVGRESILD